MEELKLSENDLLTSYYKTDYIIYDPKIIIKINEKNKELNKLLKKNNVSEWAYITAYNPMSQISSEARNESANKKLLIDIQEYKVFKGEGVGQDNTWKPEKSFLVLGVNKNKAIEIGKKYLQKAIIFGVINQSAELIILF